MLFHKTTKKVIKYVWGGFSIIIMLSMVFAYSGFSLLAGTPAQPADQIEISNESITRENGTTTQGGVELVSDDAVTDQDALPPAPTAPPALDFSL